MNRLLFIFRDMGTGGAQKIEAFVANYLFDYGYDVIAINMSNTPVTINIREEIPIYDVEYDYIHKQNNILMNTIAKAIYLLRLRKMIKSLQPDLIYAFLSDVVRIASLASKGLSIPLIGSERGDPTRFSKKQFKKYKNAYSNCSAAVFQLDDVKELYNLKSNVIQTVIPNPCIPRCSDSFSINHEKEHVIISAGRLSTQKRFDVLIDAFNLISDKYPEYILQIYGDGPLASDINNLIQNNNSSKIQLMGDVEDVFNENNHAEMFVLSSDYEGIPNVLLEAMGNGIPCISTDCSPGGAKYLLQNGEIGLIAPCGNPHALASCIETYINDKNLREKNAKSALKSLQTFNPQKIGNQWLQLTKIVLEQQRGQKWN